MKRLIILLMIIILAIVFSGCWDMVEINQRLFPYTIGVDFNPKEGEKYLITISYPNINAIGKNATQADRVHIISTTSSSVFEGSRQLLTRLPYSFYYKHLRVLIIGQELAKEEESIRQILDGLNRDFIINKKIRMVVAENKAQDILLSVPKAKRQEVIEGTIFSMLREDSGASRYTPQTLTEFIKNMDIGGVALMPRIEAYDEDIKVFGGAIFKNYALIGHIGELENISISLMKGELSRSLIDARFNGITISYAITGTQVKKKLEKKDGNIIIKLNIETEGTLQEHILQDKTSTNHIEQLKDMEKAINNYLEGQINKTLEILQKEYKADVIGIGEYIYKFHPKVWKEISSDWDEVFSTIDIEVVVDSKIRRKGLLQ